MACKYFFEDHLGFCGVTAYSHIPKIDEMEQLCFKDFHKCRIYNGYEGTHVPVSIKEQASSTQRSSKGGLIEVVH